MLDQNATSSSDPFRDSFLSNNNSMIQSLNQITSQYIERKISVKFMCLVSV